MRRRLVSVLLLGVLIILMTGFGTSCSHRGSSLEGPVAEAWVARNAGSSDGGVARDVAVDSSGNVHVTGGGYASDTRGDYLTVKYDDRGKEVWSARFDGPVSNYDCAKAMAVDASGNVYVTGFSTVEGRMGEGPYDCDYATVKYGPDGTQLWVATYNGPGSFYDEANSIALDGSGNVYVTGTSCRYSYGECFGAVEYATIKYDGHGNELWVATYRGPVDGQNCANAIAVDANGYVYVTGTSAGRGCEPLVAGQPCTVGDFATVKYDTNGDQLWVARCSAPDSGYSNALAMALDSSGNVYVTGESSGPEDGTNQDCVTAKYDSAGRELWVARLDGPASGQDSARDIAVDAAGNAYVAGYVTFDSEGMSDKDCATVKYDPHGNELWMQRYGSAPDDNWSTGGDEAFAIAVDSSGNAYVTGQSYYGGEDEDVDDDSVTIKYDSHGTQVWVARYNGQHGGDSTTAIALDGNGNVYVAGDSYGGGDHDDCLTIKYVPK